MKYFDWDEEKNQWLIKNWGISFEFIQECIEDGKVVDVANNHAPYEHQKVFFILMDEYIYEVPFVEDDEKIFFKTIHPSHKATKKYLKSKHEKN